MSNITGVACDDSIGLAYLHLGSAGKPVPDAGENLGGETVGESPEYGAFGAQQVDGGYLSFSPFSCDLGLNVTMLIHQVHQRDPERALDLTVEGWFRPIRQVEYESGDVRVA